MLNISRLTFGLVVVRLCANDIRRLVSDGVSILQTPWYPVSIGIAAIG